VAVPDLMVYAATAAAIDRLPGPVMLIDHSMGGLTKK